MTMVKCLHITEITGFNLEVPCSNTKSLPIFRIPFMLCGTSCGSHKNIHSLITTCLILGDLGLAISRLLKFGR